MKEKSHQLRLIFMGMATAFVVAFLIFPAQTSAITVQPQVAAGKHHTVELKSDGTVVAVGRNTVGQCDVDNWTDIVQVDAAHRHTVGVKNDGSMVAVGRDDHGQCDVGE